MERTHRHISTILSGALIGLTALVLILGALLIFQYRSFKQQSFPNGRGPRFFMHGTGPVTDVSLIQSWMTYDYISHVYRLPPDYLKTTLSIADLRYPRVTISQSADAQRMSVAALTEAVRNAVKDYLAKNGT